MAGKQKRGKEIEELKDPELKGETFEAYVKRIDNLDDPPYGYHLDQDGKRTAHLFHMRHKSDKVKLGWREGMEYRSDWTSIRKSGIGTKLSLTLLLIAIFFLPVIIGIPLIYLITTGSIDFFLESLLHETITYLTYILIAIFLTLLIKYSMNRVDEIVKPYGKDHNSIKVLFKDDLEYLKFSRNLTYDILSFKCFVLGGVGFFTYLIYGFISLFAFQNWKAGLLAPIPGWVQFLYIIPTIGIALVIFLALTFMGAIFYALFRIGDLGSNYKILSISIYKDLINSIEKIVSHAQINTENLADIRKKFGEEGENTLGFSGRTFYEFQRGNRKIGEFIFNVTSFLILFSILFGILIWTATTLNIIPPHLNTAANIFAIGTIIFVIISFCIFFFPQLRVHRFLKETKDDLIDSFTALISRLHYIYLQALVKPEILSQIDENWQSRQDLLNEIKFIKEYIKEISGAGTWSYDFPAVIKIVIVALSTTIPVLLAIFSI